VLWSVIFKRETRVKVSFFFEIGGYIMQDDRQKKDDEELLNLVEIIKRNATKDDRVQEIHFRMDGGVLNEPELVELTKFRFSMDSITKNLDRVIELLKKEIDS
jgi:hypothetical protein